MLPRANRLTRGTDYKAVVRRGRRCAGARTVTYVTVTDELRVPRFGFIVSKKVGSAVMRNTLRRRLKAVCAEALPVIKPGADVVIRVLPGASTASYAELRDEVSRCLMARAA
ncbi:ribonuclease P protein component [Microbacterium sp. P02]|uniref:ribonuclease P protein component n=1 Tax=Microbacterium sp. P02 TaxID=3366260 RepID=UPI00366FC8CC